MNESLVIRLNQAAINAIRAVGARDQYIFAEGNSWTGAWTWTTVNDDMKHLVDPSNRLVYEMHQYLDSDGSGSHEACVNNTIGVDRLTSATAWLKQHGKVAFLGEFAGGNNTVCEEAITGMLSYMADNTEQWLGWEFWSAGPWWGDYIFNLEPPSGVAYINILPLLEKFLA
jgi:endoglucanase